MARSGRVSPDCVTFQRPSQQRRLEKKLTLGQLARLLGYTNANKGCNRIKTFEAGGKVLPDLLSKLAEVLYFGPDEIRQAASKDYQDWLDWASEPIRPYVVVRLMPAIYQRVQLPDDVLDSQKAEVFASE